MKILHAYKDFDPPIRGGMERHIALMCRFQRQWADDVQALTCSRSFRTHHKERDGTLVTEVGEWGRFQGAPVAPLYPYYLRKHQADVFVIHSPNPTAEVSCLLFPPKGRLVVRYHSDVVRQASAMRVYRPILMKFLARADMILPTSEPYLKTSPFLIPFKDKCRVVSLGIVPEDFAAPGAERIGALTERYGGAFVFFSGRHRYYKGLENLVRAAGEIQARVVIGGDGPERPSLEGLAAELDVDVTFTGELSHDDLVAHLHACSVFAFPSVERSEAFGISILEAQVCGKPVVATKLGTGVEFANLDGVTGLNVEPRNPAALAEAINRLLSDSSLASRLGQQGRERVLDEFVAEKIAEQEFALYREVLEWS